MKRIFMAVAAVLMAMVLSSSVAAANFVQPVGTGATATGTFHFAGNIPGTTSCSLSLGGRVASSTAFGVTTGRGSCNLGGLTLANFPWTQTIDLAGSWTVATIRMTVAVPLIGNCVYEGNLGGTYESDGDALTILTIAHAASSVVKTSGSALCISVLTVAGELEINVGVA